MLLFQFQGYCRPDYKGKAVVYEFEEKWGEDMYLEMCEFKIGYDGVIVTQLPLCHDDEHLP